MAHSMPTGTLKFATSLRLQTCGASFSMRRHWDNFPVAECLALSVRISEFEFAMDPKNIARLGKRNAEFGDREWRGAESAPPLLIWAISAFQEMAQM